MPFDFEGIPKVHNVQQRPNTERHHQHAPADLSMSRTRPRARAGTWQLPPVLYPHDMCVRLAYPYGYP
eukprot:6211459-Pleurochrysis_carterae.AAC.2